MATSLTLQYQDGGKVFKDDVRAIKDALEKLNTTKENTKKDSIRYSVEKFLKSWLTWASARSSTIDNQFEKHIKNLRLWA